jgi:hypothetical protein
MLRQDLLLASQVHSVANYRGVQSSAASPELQVWATPNRTTLAVRAAAQQLRRDYHPSDKYAPFKPLVTIPLHSD